MLMLFLNIALIKKVIIKKGNTSLMEKEKREQNTDEILVEKIMAGDTEAMDFLMNKYRNLVRSLARPLFLVGADKEDLIQEGMIGLYRQFVILKKKKRFLFYILQRFVLIGKCIVQ